MREVHEGVCENHSGADLLFLKLIRLATIGPEEARREGICTKYDKCAYQKIEEREVINFIWDHIICRFGILKEIACDNGPQVIGSKVTKFSEGLTIKQITSSPYHPSANGQSESTNNIIIQNLKKKLEDAKGKWPDELLSVLWPYRIMTKSSTCEMPFSLVYAVEALIPMEIGEPTIRYSRANEEANNEALLIKLVD
nr:uncharacterized protein LOC117276600 [Nicotiana tomentosiformis]